MRNTRYIFLLVGLSLGLSACSEKTEEETFSAPVLSLQVYATSKTEPAKKMSLASLTPSPSGAGSARKVTQINLALTELSLNASGLAVDPLILIQNSAENRPAADKIRTLANWIDTGTTLYAFGKTLLNGQDYSLPQNNEFTVTGKKVGNAYEVSIVFPVAETIFQKLWSILNSGPYTEIGASVAIAASATVSTYIDHCTVVISPFQVPGGVELNPTVQYLGDSTSSVNRMQCEGALYAPATVTSVWGTGTLTVATRYFVPRNLFVAPNTESGITTLMVSLLGFGQMTIQIPYLVTLPSITIINSSPAPSAAPVVMGPASEVMSACYPGGQGFTACIPVSDEEQCQLHTERLGHVFYSIFPYQPCGPEVSLSYYSVALEVNQDSISIPSLTLESGSSPKARTEGAGLTARFIDSEGRILYEAALGPITENIYELEAGDAPFIPEITSQSQLYAISVPYFPDILKVYVLDSAGNEIGRVSFMEANP